MKPTPESIDEMLDACHFDANVAGPFRKQIAIDGVVDPALAEEIAALLCTAARTSMRESYAVLFSAEEVAQMTADHSSPLGQKQLALAPLLMTAVEAAVSAACDRFAKAQP